MHYVAGMRVHLGSLVHLRQTLQTGKLQRECSALQWLRRTAVGESDGARVGIQVGASVGVTISVLVGSGTTSAKSAGRLRSSSILTETACAVLLHMMYMMYMLRAHVEVIRPTSLRFPPDTASPLDACLAGRSGGLWTRVVAGSPLDGPERAEQVRGDLGRSAQRTDDRDERERDESHRR
jgi:hypothetical protein